MTGYFALAKIHAAIRHCRPILLAGSLFAAMLLEPDRGQGEEPLPPELEPLLVERVSPLRQATVLMRDAAGLPLEEQTLVRSVDQISLQRHYFHHWQKVWVSTPAYEFCLLRDHPGQPYALWQLDPLNTGPLVSRLSIEYPVHHVLDADRAIYFWTFADLEPVIDFVRVVLA